MQRPKYPIIEPATVYKDLYADRRVIVIDVQEVEHPGPLKEMCPCRLPFSCYDHPPTIRPPRGISPVTGKPTMMPQRLTMLVEQRDGSYQKAYRTLYPGGYHTLFEAERNPFLDRSTGRPQHPPPPLAAPGTPHAVHHPFRAADYPGLLANTDAAWEERVDDHFHSEDMQYYDDGDIGIPECDYSHDSSNPCPTCIMRTADYYLQHNIEQRQHYEYDENTYRDAALDNFYVTSITSVPSLSPLQKANMLSQVMAEHPNDPIPIAAFEQEMNKAVIERQEEERRSLTMIGISGPCNATASRAILYNMMEPMLSDVDSMSTDHSMFQGASDDPYSVST